MRGAAQHGQAQAFRAAADWTTAKGDADEGPDLDILAQEIMQQFGMLRAGLQGDYAARIKWAGKNLPKASRAGAIRALQNERTEALAALARRAAQTVRGRLAAARLARRRAQIIAPKPAG